jgi:hypothetical protein
MDVKMRKKKAQITIFVILALMLVVGIALIFVLVRGPGVQVSEEENPQQFIDSCVGDSVEEAVEILSRRGGYIEPSNYKLFLDEKIGYLCYNANNYFNCINQEPQLITHIEEEIADYIYNDVEDCFESLKTSLEDSNHEVEMGSLKFEVVLSYRNVLVDIKRDFKMSKRGETRDFNNFQVNYIHPIYDLANVAIEAVNQESKFCNFDYDGYRIFNRDFSINKPLTRDGTEIYEIGDVLTNERFIFAVRGCDTGGFVN